jgi:hypothetical protein
VRRKSWRSFAAVVMAAIVIASTACSSIMHPSFGSGESAGAWSTTLATARNRAATGDYGGADSALSQFARQFPGTSAALETAYWRALFKMDPANHSASLTTAMASLDGYLADTRSREHAPEAASLRRIAAQLDGLNKIAMSAVAQAKDAKATAANATAAANDAKDAKDAASKVAADVTTSTASADEIKRLKDELAKANAELDRIRKRLSQPSKP